MPLFRVSYEGEIFIVAEDKAEAEMDAAMHIRESLSDSMECDVQFVDEVKDVSQIPRDWLDAIPYGGEGGKTCAELVPPPRDDKTLPLPL